MCFNKHPSHKKVKVAEHNILCWKALEKDHKGILHSPYQWTVYEYGQMQHAKFIHTNYNTHPDQIHQGLHSYSDKNKFVIAFNEINVYPAIIPKGTQFYYNPKSQELVSEALVVFNNLSSALNACGQLHIGQAVQL